MCSRFHSVLRDRGSLRVALLAIAGAVAGVPLGAQVSVPGGAASAVSARFSLADAVALAGARHPALRAASGRRQAELGVARQDATLPNPVFEYRRENLGAPIAPDIFTTITLPVDLVLRRLALRGVVGDVAARTAADSAGAARGVVYDVARSYWRATLAHALGDVAAAQRAAVDSLALVEERRAREGAIPEGTAMRARLEADRVRLAAAAARADAERARADLARALALPPTAVPWPTDSLGDAPARDTLQSVAASYDSAGLARLVAGALRARPDVIAARARVAAAERRVAAERLGAVPAFGLIGGAKRTGGYETGVIGVAVGLPVFDRNANLRARAAGELALARADVQLVEAQAAADVTAGARAYAALIAEGPPGALDRRGAEVAAVTRAAYREGAASLLELLDAERARADVRAAALRWAADLRLAALELTRATTAGAPFTPDASPNPGLGPALPTPR